jgi:hypothetical protein
MIQQELSGEIIGAGMDVLNELRKRDWNGNAYCARERLANATRPIFIPEPYPFNPWFF